MMIGNNCEAGHDEDDENRDHNHDNQDHQDDYDDGDDMQVLGVRETNWCFQGIAYVLHLRIPNKPQKSQNTPKSQIISEYPKSQQKSQNTQSTTQIPRILGIPQKFVKYPRNYQNHRIPMQTTNNFRIPQKI